MTDGEKWIRLLRAYGPVADNEAMQAEHVGKLAAHLGVPKLAFDHPESGARIRCEAPLPLDLRAALALLGLTP